MLCNQGDSGADPPVTGHRCSGGDDEGYPHFQTKRCLGFLSPCYNSGSEILSKVENPGAMVAVTSSPLIWFSPHTAVPLLGPATYLKQSKMLVPRLLSPF